MMILSDKHNDFTYEIMKLNLFYLIMLNKNIILLNYNNDK